MQAIWLTPLFCSVAAAAALVLQGARSLEAAGVAVVVRVGHDAAAQKAQRGVVRLAGVAGEEHDASHADGGALGVVNRAAEQRVDAVTL